MTTLRILAPFTAAVLLASCYGPEPRPFTGRGGRPLDQPPRYGESTRYMDPGQPPPSTTVPLPPDPNLDPAAAPGVDGGLVVNPPASAPAPAPSPAPSPAPVTSDVPFARAVPGKPGFVYSPRDQKKIISVEGLRPGQKAKDPETGDIFRVPY